MSLFFRRRNIKGLFRSIRFIFNEPSLLKVVILFIVLMFVFNFRFWAERQAPQLFLQASEGSVRAVSAQPSLPDNKKARTFKTIDVNRASQKELESLPGIGPKLADAILKNRLEKGLFHRADDLLRVRGIGPKRLKK
jgi:competence ComEA-like helix-hairpin-helix protein